LHVLLIVHVKYAIRVTHRVYCSLSKRDISPTNVPVLLADQA
jgi:hypothetical protein